MNKLFTDIMEPGIDIISSHGFMIPDYLTIEDIHSITMDDHINPANLQANTAYVYTDNLYLTDDDGNIAFIDCNLVLTSSTRQIRKDHPEYRSVSVNDHDAGHFGLSLGQHPSIAMEQSPYMNRYGIWRIFERYWTNILKDGIGVRLIGVFVEGNGTFSPFWCIHEELDGKVTEYVFSNDDNQ